MGNKGNGQAETDGIVIAMRQIMAEQDPDEQVILCFMKTGAQIAVSHGKIHAGVLMTYAPSGTPTGFIPLDNLAAVLIQDRPPEPGRVQQPPPGLLVPTQ